MTYLDYINNFWQKDLEFSFTADEVNLYFRLLKHANALGWKPRFNLSVEKLMAEIGMRTKKPFDTARKGLREAGLLDFKNGNGRGCTTEYHLIATERAPEKGMKNTPLSVPLSGTLSGEVSGLLHKNKIKNKKSTASADTHSPVLRNELKSNVSGSPIHLTADQPTQPAARLKKTVARQEEIAALALPHPGPAFAQLWADFVAMPKQVKKPLTALRRLLATLGKYAEGFAVLMLEKAIGGDWSGVEYDNTPDAYAKWQAEQARRPAPPFPTARPAAPVQADPAPNAKFVAEKQAREQAELDRLQAEWREAHAPTVEVDPNKEFGYNQSAAEGLAQARNSPDYQRYLAEEAAKAAEQAAAQQPDPPENEQQAP